MRYNLRAATDAALTEALTAAGLLTADGPAPSITLDIIGTIPLPTGAMLDTPDGPLPEVAPIPGWHANLIADLTPDQEALLPIIAAPANPYRIFAGE